MSVKMAKGMPCERSARLASNVGLLEVPPFKVSPLLLLAFLPDVLESVLYVIYLIVVLPCIVTP